MGAIAASSSPTPSETHVEKRADISDVLAIINTLETATTPILSSIDTVAGSILPSSVTLTPLVASLVASLNTASASLALLGTVSPTGGSPATIAAATAPIVSNIVRTLNNAKRTIPGVNLVVATLGLDASLNQVLVGLENSTAGVLNLLAQL
ncbi:hypothetical protein JR316_0010791 [Psilocybe cubensis]|uniref:Uncharacterized protein n=2 Tax=Psilocybe cubensis TaxID=181762 RepID=A0ACB8GM88_PSICU|nr:hypothetical protein JR316_0010791 [Psilocybe cubensis]KAH9476875.1 hypothetical protein JR316_0010791 [Psilocybe cubensis]